MDDDGPALLAPDLAALGVSTSWRLIAQLAGGQSGSGVFRLEIDGRHVVLKVTRDPDRIAGAHRELVLYRDLGGPFATFRPQLMAGHGDPDDVRILLAAHRPALPATGWTHSAWVEFAELLGRLHRAPVPDAPWLRPRDEVSPEAVTVAIDGWGRYGAEALARRAAEQWAGTCSVEPEPAVALVHGDCHVGSVVLTDTGRSLLVDWTEVGLGAGPADLVFLWQRAEFDGARPPRDAMADAYATARRWSPGRLRAALDGSERRSLLLDWPPFLDHGDDRARAFMIGRLQRLVDDGDSVTRRY